LLALLKASGGALSNTDMEKLLFCYCAETGSHDYDFFPYRFGCFSFLSYQDKRVLTSQGYLFAGERFKLKKQTMSSRLSAGQERESIQAFVMRMKGLRGKKLVRHVYLKYPYFATRSEIVGKILSIEEQKIVETHANKESNPVLFTAGYEGLTIDAYIDKLIRNNVAMVVDVRRNPISMKYGFSKTRFSAYLRSAGVKYEHIPQLGIESNLRKNLETKEDYDRLFDAYARHSLPKNEEELSHVRKLLAEHKRIALTCFEADHTSCHRHKITERLEHSKGWGIPIKHI
jgi:uncharacterized protein (DUF488 family)